MADTPDVEIDINELLTGYAAKNAALTTSLVIAEAKVAKLHKGLTQALEIIRQKDEEIASLTEQRDAAQAVIDAEPRIEEAASHRA
jgi:hypothetical protein